MASYIILPWRTRWWSKSAPIQSWGRCTARFYESAYPHKVSAFIDKANVIICTFHRVWACCSAGVDSYVRKHAAVKRIAPVSGGRAWKKTSYRVGIHTIGCSVHGVKLCHSLLGPPSRPVLSETGGVWLIEALFPPPPHESLGTRLGSPLCSPKVQEQVKINCKKKIKNYIFCPIYDILSVPVLCLYNNDYVVELYLIA